MYFELENTYVTIVIKHHEVSLGAAMSASGFSVASLLVHLSHYARVYPTSQYTGPKTKVPFPSTPTPTPCTHLNTLRDQVEFDAR